MLCEGSHGNDYGGNDSKCSTCHGNLDTKPSKFSEITVNNGFCFRCHYGKGGSEKGFVVDTTALGIQTPAAPTSTAAVPEAKIVTSADDNKTITLQVNETFLLKLGEGYYWNITIDDQTIISRVPNVLVVRGAQGIYRAHEPGRATLTAFGKPICPPGQPCPELVRVFRLYIIVTGVPTATPKAPAFEVLFAISALMIALLVRRR